MFENQEDLTWIEALICEAVSRSFYGEVSIIFESGRIVHVVRKESLRPKTNKDTEKKKPKFPGSQGK